VSIDQTTSTSDALQELATRVAMRLVANALHRLTGGTPPSITLAPVPQTLALPPAKRRGRKSGQKPKKEKRGVRPRKFAKPVPERASLSLAPRRLMCRKCRHIGLCARVEGTARAVRCGSCGFKWDARAQASEAGKTEPAICTKCDHDEAQHEHGGRCLVPRCACMEFYR